MLPGSDMLQNISPEVAIAGTLTRRDLEEVRRRGFTVVLDLRRRDEPVSGGLSPAEEEAEARGLGLEYHRVELAPQDVDDRVVERVREVLAASRGRVVVHCASGRRAAVLAVLDRGCREGWTPAQCLARVRELGYDCDAVPALGDLLRRYVAAHGPEGRRRDAAESGRGTAVPGR